MLISHKHKFITIDVPKTGTTSINQTLKPFLGKNDFSCKMSQKLGMRHATYGDCIGNFPGFEHYFSFAFVRNPWDRMVSYYFFRKCNDGVKIDKNISFEEVIKTFQPPNQYSFLKHFGENSFIGRFENLQEDFDIICDKIGIPHQQLPHNNKTKHKHYTKYYDDKTREIVAERFAKDIEYFGYKFGDLSNL